MSFMVLALTRPTNESPSNRPQNAEERGSMIRALRIALLLPQPYSMINRPFIISKPSVYRTTYAPCGRNDAST